MSSRRIQNTAGSAKSFLNAVDKQDKASKYEANAIALAGKQHEKLIKAVMQAVRQYVDDSDRYDKSLDSKSIDVTLGRIASLLDEVKDKFVKTELAEAKKEILDEVSGLTTGGVLKSFLLSQLSNLFDDDAKKEDIEELKDWMSKTFGASSKSSQQTAESETSENESTLEDILNASSEEENTEDEEVGDYKDSTVAKNFDTLQTYINQQMESLNGNIKSISSGKGFIGAIGAAVAKPFKLLYTGMTKLGKGVGKVISRTASIAKSLVGVSFNAIVGGIGKLAKGLGKIGAGVAGLGKKALGAAAKPFKAIGGFFKSLNPFKSREKRAEEKKQRLRDKVMEAISNVIGKTYKLIQPFISMATKWMLGILVTVVVPIAVIMAKVLLIIGTIIAIGIGLYLAYRLVKKKIMSFWNTLVEIWDFIKDFGTWVWDVICDAVYYILVGMWVDLGKWIWKKLCQFGNWLYDTLIYPYIVKPFKKYIWDPVKKLWNETVWPTIEPFVNSLIELKDKIVKAFSAWDSNKSIWENLKNISGIIIDAVKEWWEKSPFKTFYDKYLDPIVKSLGNLINRIKTIWNNFKWDENKSFIDNCKNLVGTIVDAVKKWWNDPENPIRAIWDKIVAWINDMTKPIIEWWNNSWLGKTFQEGWTSLKSKWDEFKAAWDAFSFKDTIQAWWEQSKLKEWIDKIFGWIEGIYDKTVGAVKKVAEKTKGLITGVDPDTLAQHGEAWGKIPTEFNKSLSTVEDVDKQLAYMESRLKYLNGRNPEAASLVMQNIEDLKARKKQLAAQQVSSAMQTVNNIETSKAAVNMDLQKSGQEMSQAVADKEKEQKEKDAWMMNAVTNLGIQMNNQHNEVMKEVNDPLMMPTAVPARQSINSALLMR